MASAWWSHLEFADWQIRYQQAPLLRPALNRMICQRLGHIGPAPKLTVLARRLFGHEQRRITLGIGLGLWAIAGASLLWLKPYREQLATRVTLTELEQLKLLLPVQTTVQMELSPERLLSVLDEQMAAWLSQSNDMAVRLCRLFWPPAQTLAANVPLASALAKLDEWL